MQITPEEINLVSCLLANALTQGLSKSELHSLRFFVGQLGANISTICALKYDKNEKPHTDKDKRPINE